MASVKSVTIYDDYPSRGKRERRYEVTITPNNGRDEVYVLPSQLVDESDDGTAAANRKLISLGDIEAGSKVDKTSQYQNQNDYDRIALGQAMTLESTDEFYEALPLFKAMEGRGGSNANARAAYLEVNRDFYKDMADRFNDVEGIAFFLDDAKEQIWEDVPEEWK